MFPAKTILAAALAIGVVYAACPYVTLYRLDNAIHTGDAATLQGLVNWPAVREGIKEDICDNVVADPDATAGVGKLPAFGASFVRGIASSAVDQRITAEGLVDMTHHHATGIAQPDAAMRINWAFFSNPTDFMVSLDAPGQRHPIKLQLSLSDAGWRVIRVWLPPAMLGQTDPSTS
jgi:hypothetical protein